VVYFPNLSGRFGFETLMLFFVLAAVLMVILFFLGVGAFVSLGINNASLVSMFEDRQTWNDQYGKDAFLESVQTLSSGYHTIVAVVALACAFFLALVVLRGVTIAGSQTKDRTQALFLVFNNFLLPLAASAFLYVALAASIEMRDLPTVGTRYMPDFATGLFVAAAVCLFALTGLGLIAAAKENSGQLQFYRAALSLGSLVVLAACILVAISDSSFPNYYKQNWAEVMLQVDQAHFSTREMGCYGGKYIHGVNSTNLYDLPCEQKA